jgi:hypothetical protein
MIGVIPSRRPAPCRWRPPRSRLGDVRPRPGELDGDALGAAAQVDGPRGREPGRAQGLGSASPVGDEPAERHPIDTLPGGAESIREVVEGPSDRDYGVFLLVLIPRLWPADARRHCRSTLPPSPVPPDMATCLAGSDAEPGRSRRAWRASAFFSNARQARIAASPRIPIVPDVRCTALLTSCSSGSTLRGIAGGRPGST